MGGFVSSYEQYGISGICDESKSVFDKIIRWWIRGTVKCVDTAFYDADWVLATVNQVRGGASHNIKI